MARSDAEGQIGGGGYNNFEFTVTAAWFGISEAFAAKVKGGDQVIMLHWVGDTTLDGVPTFEADGFHPSYMLNEDWEATDGGKAIRWVGNPGTAERSRKTGKWYGRMLSELLANDEISALPEGQHFLDGPEGMQLQAATWVGTKWFMEDKFYEFSKGNPNMSDATHLMPTKFLGKVAVTAPAVAPAAPAAAPAPVADNSALRAQAIALAATLDDYKLWQTTVLGLPGVAQDQALVLEIANDKADGLYEVARA